MSKLLKTLNKLLRFKKQTMDALRLQLAQKQQEMDLTMDVIESEKKAVHHEQTRISEFLDFSTSYTAFLDHSYTTIQQHEEKIHRLQIEADEILSTIQQEFSESKAYETVKENILEKMLGNEKRQENETLDDIASRSVS